MLLFPAGVLRHAVRLGVEVDVGLRDRPEIPLDLAGEVGPAPVVRADRLLARAEYIP